VSWSRAVPPVLQSVVPHSHNPGRQTATVVVADRPATLSAVPTEPDLHATSAELVAGSSEGTVAVSSEGTVAVVRYGSVESCRTRPTSMTPDRWSHSRIAIDPPAIVDCGDSDRETSAIPRVFWSLETYSTRPALDWFASFRKSLGTAEWTDRRWNLWFEKIICFCRLLWTPVAFRLYDRIQFLRMRRYSGVGDWGVIFPGGSFGKITFLRNVFSILRERISLVVELAVRQVDHEDKENKENEPDHDSTKGKITLKCLKYNTKDLI